MTVQGAEQAYVGASGQILSNDRGQSAFRKAADLNISAVIKSMNSPLQS